MLDPWRPGWFRLAAVALVVAMAAPAIKEPGALPRPTVEQPARHVEGFRAVPDRLPGRRDHWSQRFFDLMADFRYVPGGRIMAAMGSGAGVTAQEVTVGLLKYSGTFSHVITAYGEKGIAKRRVIAYGTRAGLGHRSRRHRRSW